jgi:hypothetical protein
MAHDVFISYRNEDKASADRLCNGLESQGIACWIAPRNIPGGTEWPAAIVEAIGACKVFVMVLSSHSINAKQISREAELADKNGCQIITFRLEDVQPPAGLSYFLGNIQWIDAFGDEFEAAVAKVAQIINKSPEAAARALPPAPPGRRIPWISVAAVVGLVVLGAGLWFGLHRPTLPTPAPILTPTPVVADAMSQAKAVADRFLTEREAGQLDAAWAELTDNFQKKLDKSKWLKAQAALTEHGHLTNKFEGCTLSGNGYFCGYLLTAKDGTDERSKLWLIRDQDGNWKISRSELLKPAKS